MRRVGLVHEKLFVESISYNYNHWALIGDLGS